MGVDAIQTTTTKEFKKLEEQLSIKLQQTLVDSVPHPEQLEALSRVIPEILLTVHELLRKQEVSNLKGKEAEQELYDELTSYYPQDQITHLGKSGETDIILTPMINGVSTLCSVCVESKKNSKWSRNFIDELRRHMKNKASSYGILAVETMPSGASLYFTETHPEGTIFVTSREYCKVAYGALRAVISSDYSQSRRQLNLQYALRNNRIQTAIQGAFTSTRRLESIRKSTNTIITNAKKISDEADEAEYIIQSCLTELQTTIEDELESYTRTDQTISQIVPEMTHLD
jgi:hypothetical protein